VARYNVMMTREMSQVITVEADSIDEAVRLASDQNSLAASFGDAFEDCGDVKTFSVSDAAGNEIWNDVTGRDLDI
jgi:hypothetical protein